MSEFESSLSVSDRIDLVRARVERRKKAVAGKRLKRSVPSTVATSPTKELDALVLGNSLIGYGDKISIENMAIIENVITMSKMEANYEVPANKDPKAGVLGPNWEGPYQVIEVLREGTFKIARLNGEVVPRT